MEINNVYLKTLAYNPLSVLRILISFFVGRSLIGLLDRIYSISHYSIGSYSKTWIVSLFPDSMLSFDQQYYTSYLVLIVLSSIFSAIGLLGRVNLIILAVLSFLFGGMNEGLGNFYHDMSLTSQLLLVLAIVPGSMKLSVDQLVLKKFFKNKKPNGKEIKSPNWGINLVLAIVVLTYLSAGISKVRYSGFQWFDGSTLKFYLNNHISKYPDGEKQLIIGNDFMESAEKYKDKYGFHAHTYGNFQGSRLIKSITSWMASKDYVVSILSILTVILEISGFIVFFNGKLRNIFLLSAILAHTSIGILMGLYFTNYRIICLCLMDWPLIINSVERTYKRMFGGAQEKLQY